MFAVEFFRSTLIHFICDGPKKNTYSHIPSKPHGVSVGRERSHWQQFHICRLDFFLSLLFRYPIFFSCYFRMGFLFDFAVAENSYGFWHLMPTVWAKLMARENQLEIVFIFVPKLRQFREIECGISFAPLIMIRKASMISSQQEHLADWIWVLDIT